MANFVSSVRFQAKSGERDNVLEKMKAFALPEGAMNHTVVETGVDTFCTFVIWKEKESLVKARPQMIAFLDTIRGQLEELSGDLGVTDPVSGPVVFRSN